MKQLTQLIERRGSTTSVSNLAGRGKSRSLGLWWTFAAGLVLAAATIVAIVQNSRPVRLDYLVWHANVTLIVVVLATALIAVVLDEVGGLVWRRRRRSRLGRRDELAQLRTERQRSEEVPAATEPPTPLAAASALSVRRVGPEI